MSDYVTSADGTQIAFSQDGSGDPLILVDGAGGHRGFGPLVGLPALLADGFAVTHYDRRGRGDSGDNQPYAPDREVEDLAALIEAVGGHAHLFGISSGAALALRASAAGLAVTRLVVYEPPYINTGGEGHRAPNNALEQLQHMIGEGRRSDAVRFFLVDTVGSPRLVPMLMRLMPGKPWAALTTVAHTLAYDVELMDRFVVPTEMLASIPTPTTALAGGRSPNNMIEGVRTVAEAIPGASFQLVPDQTHMIRAKALAPQLRNTLARS